MPDDSGSQFNIKPVATAGVAALGASLLFPTYAGASFMGGGGIAQVAVIAGAGALGWLAGTLMSKTVEASMPPESTKPAERAARPPQQEQAPQKEWAKSVERGGCGHER